MPFIVVARPDMEHTAGSAVQGLGRNIAAIGLTLQQIRDRDKALEVERTRAEAALLREQNADAARQALAQERAAGVAGSVAGLKALGESGMRATLAQSVDEGMKKPLGSILGPFGMLNPRAVMGGLKSAAEIKERMDHNMALASYMSPVDARAHLTRAAAEEKDYARKAGLQADLRALNNAVADGVIDERKAKLFSSALQSAVREGRDPGEIHARIAKEYDLHSQLKARAKGWAEADKNATQMISDIERTAAGIQDPDLKQAIAEKVAMARGEWAKTEYPSFRMESDAGKSLAALQALLYQAQASAGAPVSRTKTEQAVGDEGVRDDAFTPERRAAREMAGLRFFIPGMAGQSTQQQQQPQAPAPTTTPGRTRAPGPKQQQAGDDADAFTPERSGIRAMTGQQLSVPPEDLAAKNRLRADMGLPPIASTLPQQSGQPDEVRLRTLVRAGAYEALQAGTTEERAKRIGVLRKHIADELGLDVEDPAVMKRVRQALSEVYDQPK